MKTRKVYKYLVVYDYRGGNGSCVLTRNAKMCKSDEPEAAEFIESLDTVLKDKNVAIRNYGLME